MKWEIGDIKGQTTLFDQDVRPVKVKKGLYTLEDKIKESQRALRLASDMSKTYYGKPIIICYSGGKDSDVLLQLAKDTLPLTDFEVLNSHTTLDAPPTVKHIEEVFKEINDGGAMPIILTVTRYTTRYGI